MNILAKTYDIAFKLAAKLDKTYGNTFAKAESIANNVTKSIGNMAAKKTVTPNIPFVTSVDGCEFSCDTCSEPLSSCAHCAFYKGVKKYQLVEAVKASYSPFTGGEKRAGQYLRKNKKVKLWKVINKGNQLMS